MLRTVTAGAQAHNFQRIIPGAWDNGILATDLAQTRGAVHIGAFAHEEYHLEPGDMPGSLWQFPDSTILVIGDNGHWCCPPSHLARKRGDVWVLASGQVAFPPGAQD